MESRQPAPGVSQNRPGLAVIPRPPEEALFPETSRIGFLRTQGTKLMRSFLNQSWFGSTPLTARFVGFISFLLCLLMLPSRAATIKTWDGSSSGLWSDGANWSGGTSPQNGDQLRFPQGTSHRTMTNNLTNFQVPLVFFPDPASTNYVIRGNPLTIGGASSPGSGGVQSNQTNGVNQIDCDITILRSDSGGAQNFLFIFPGSGSLIFGGEITLAQDGISLRSDVGSSLEFSGSISGTGSVFVVGAGNVTFDGRTANTFNGTTFVQHGTVLLNKSDLVVPLGTVGRVCIPGDLVISASGITRLLFHSQIADTANVSVFTTL